MDDVTPIRPATESLDGYSAGDVILDGDGRWWRMSVCEIWYTFGSDIDADYGSDMPEPWTLVARAGEAMDLKRARDIAITMSEQNDLLRGKFASVQRQLANIAELVGDAKGDIGITLARTDPLRGGE